MTHFFFLVIDILYFIQNYRNDPLEVRNIQQDVAEIFIWKSESVSGIFIPENEDVLRHNSYKVIWRVWID